MMSPDRRWPAALPGSRAVHTLKRSEQLKPLRGDFGDLEVTAGKMLLPRWDWPGRNGLGELSPEHPVAEP